MKGSRTLRIVALTLTLAAIPAFSAQADTLLVDRAKASHVAGPKRGSTMAQVQAQFGAPSSQLDPRGGQQPQWPVINRWEYPEFIVYFERDKVINVVARKASPNETGPKPVN
ncbi:MAG: hypothetical protein R3F10_06475 [Lysobacteraceae bacterium]